MKHRLKAAGLMLFAALLPLYSAALNPPARSVLTGFDRELARAIDGYVARAMDELDSPGMIVGVVQGNTLAYAGYFGYADLSTGRLVGEDTFFRIGSISKSATAIGLLQQWEKGRFSLDDDINTYLPEPLVFPPHPESRPVTFHHLFTHTSGGGEFLSYRQILLPGQGIQVDGYNYEPLHYYLSLGMKTRLDPGEVYAYSNYGYGFLGLALENISGTPFHQYMIENVFRPLGMMETTFHHDPAMMERMAVGYKPRPEQNEAAARLDRARERDLYHEEYKFTPHRAGGITPAGNIYATLDEFALYAAALLNGGANANGRVIKPETLEMMMTTQYTLDPRQGGYGYAFRVIANPWGLRIVGHSGSVPFGYTANMLLLPDERLGVIACSNSMTRAPNDITWRVLRMARGLEDLAPAPVRPTPELWTGLEGIYGPEYHHFKINARLAMNGIGNYQIMLDNDDLLMFYTWQGRDQAQKLIPIDPDDPYFFMVERKEDNPAPPALVSFKKEGGRVYIIPGGLNRYVKLEGFEKTRAVMNIPAGRALSAVNPF